MIDCANSKCRITGKICSAWSEVAGCGLVRCKFMEKKDGDEILNGEMAKDRHQLTNADRMRAMDDEELAKFIISIPMCVGIYEGKDCEEDGCKDCFLKWLQQPAEEANHANL